LLHDIGKLVLGNFLSQEMLGWLESASRNGGVAAYRAEAEILSLHHGEVGGIVAQHWQLPEEIVYGINYHHGPDEIDHPIAYAVYLANLIAHGWESEEEQENAAASMGPSDMIALSLERLGISEATYLGFGPIVRARLKLALAGYD
jgi:HD-like signal output (HDOD) protein